MSKTEVAGERGGGGVGWGVRAENGLADVKLNGMQGLQLDLFYMMRYHVHYHYVIAIVILLLRGLLSMNML